MTSSKDSGADKPLTIAWLRRDLRLHDHAVLHEALGRDGPVQLVFIFDTDILARFDRKDDRRLTFIAHSVKRIHTQLKQHGGGLLVLHGSAKQVMPPLCRAVKATTLVAARDVEPGCRERDREVYKALEGITEMVGVVDHLLLWPDRVVKDDGSPLQVFTPFSKRFRAVVTGADLAEKSVRLRKEKMADYPSIQRISEEAQLRVIDADASVAEMLKAIGYEEAALGEWSVDDVGKRLERFVNAHVNDYAAQRDLPAEEGTSKLSPYLRFGLISVRECARAVWDRGGKGAETWAKELIWREFYAMILYHYPEVVTEDFQHKYRGKLDWSQDRKAFQRWCDGMTGYPFVDAAMRQLNSTGWMHNRTRMVVASFLTKDMRIDWRWGEEYFAQLLMDYDLASNNGGWQWSASTGTDAQPWFRIFNPILQAKKFDPEGAYVRTFVPELKSLPTKFIHEPWDADVTLDYPERVVDHYKARDETLQMFKSVAS